MGSRMVARRRQLLIGIDLDFYRIANPKQPFLHIGNMINRAVRQFFCVRYSNAPHLADKKAGITDLPHRTA